MHYAKLSESKRLQKLADFLADGRVHTTRDIIVATGVCAVNSAVSELRRNGIDIECKYAGRTEDGNRVYEYALTAEPELAL